MRQYKKGEALGRGFKSSPGSQHLKSPVYWAFLITKDFSFCEPVKLIVFVRSPAVLLGSNERFS